MAAAPSRAPRPELGVDLAVGELAGHPEAEQPEGDQGGHPHQDGDPSSLRTRNTAKPTIAHHSGRFPTGNRRNGRRNPQPFPDGDAGAGDVAPWSADDLVRGTAGNWGKTVAQSVAMLTTVHERSAARCRASSAPAW
jgi:hypothetical protein